jgi:thiosulfate reductase cytochrome b subunit
MPTVQQKHRFVTRWTHWVNFPVLLVMIWSGLLIYWANDVYRIGIGSVTVFHFFPDWVYRLLNADHQLADGMAIHFLFMWIFALNGVLYVAYTMVSGAWREMVPNRSSFRDALQVVRYDLGLSKSRPPQGKYNAAQKISYTGIIVMGFGSLLTGLAIYRPTQTAWLTTLTGGYQMARWEHFLLACGYLAFFAVHIAQVIRAGWNNFRSMVTGFEVVSGDAHGR